MALLPFPEALKMALEQIHLLEAKRFSMVDLVQAPTGLPLVLAEDVFSSRNIPPWANSAMDGFAVQGQDVLSATLDAPVCLKIIGEIPAGKKSNLTLQSGQAIRIMTGAPVAQGADTVVPIEDTEKKSDQEILIYCADKKGKHIRKAGEDVKKDERVFQKGQLLNPYALGVLASIGVKDVSVTPKPRVAFFTTGEELKSFEECSGTLQEAQIVDSNTPTLMTLLKELGCSIRSLGVVADKKEEISRSLKETFRHSDMVLTCGGISVGQFDFIKEEFQKLGGEVIFWRLGVKPGKPLLFGLFQKIPFFALPGNPVSVGILFEEMVRPALLKMMGYSRIFRPLVWAIADQEIRDSEKRTCFLRVLLEEKEGQWHCHTTGMQGSHILTGMAKAQGLAILPEGFGKISKGQKVAVRLLSPGVEFKKDWGDVLAS